MSEIKEIIEDTKGDELKPQEFISPSSINTYFKCPRCYFYNYIAKILTKPNIHLIKGGIVHKVLEDFFRGYKPDMEKVIINLFNKTWEKNQKQIKNLELKEDEVKTARLDCLNMINEYYITFKRKVDSLVAVGKAENESHAYYLLKPKMRELFVTDKKLKCRGYIDRIHEDYNGVLTLGDYKTSGKYGIGLPDDYKRQLSLYSLLYLNQEKRMPDFVSVVFLRYGEEYLLEVTPSLLRYARNTITETYSKTRSTAIEEYPKKEGTLCRWCQYLKICDGHENWDKLLRTQKIKQLAKKEAKKNEGKSK